MKGLMLCVLAVGWGIAIAQAPPEAAATEEEARQPGAGDPAGPCVFPGDAGLDGEDGAIAATEEPCDGSETMTEDSEVAVEATADEVFEPDSEISEDYPVPLPSDI